MARARTLPRPAPGRVVVWSLAALLVVVIMATGAEDRLARVGAISALAVALFATRLLPEVVTALGCFLAFIAIGAAPADVIFSGFASSGFWLLFAGLVIGTAITATGLGQQVALRIFARTGRSYRRAALLLALSGLGLGLLVPSTIPRVIVMMPIALSLAQTMGYAVGSRGHVGLTIMAATATNLPTFGILTANLPTIIHFGAIETLYGVRPSYAGYFVLQAPVNLLRFAVLLALLVPHAPATADAAPDLEEPAPLTPPQTRLLILLGVAILFWATDAVHGIPPAWVALSLAMVLLVPGFGMLGADAMKSKVDMSPAFFLAAVFAISAVAQHTGLGAAISERVLPHLGLGQGGGLRDLLAVSGVSMLVSHFATAPAAPAVLAPLAAAFADGTGWPIGTVAMAQVVGLSTPILPYQAPPLIVSMALAQIPALPLMRICALLALAVAIVGVPMTYLWWTWLGAFG